MYKEKNLRLLMLEDEISLDDLKQHRASLEAKRARLQNTEDGKISQVELNAPFGLIANATRGSETAQSGCRAWIRTRA